MDQQERIGRATLLDPTQDGTTAPSVEEHESGLVFGGLEAARIIVVALAAMAAWFSIQAYTTRRPISATALPPPDIGSQ
jgi:hypothetical protein